jgi:hypothetical protein
MYCSCDRVSSEVSWRRLPLGSQQITDGFTEGQLNSGSWRKATSRVNLWYGCTFDPSALLIVLRACACVCDVSSLSLFACAM